MNLSEFQAWFDGFTENMDGPPNEKQWKRIKKRVGEITSDPTSYPVFIRQYYRPYERWFWVGTDGQTYMSNNNTAMNMADGTARFATAGRAEAAQMAARGSAG